jgi:hypothetical protein
MSTIGNVLTGWAATMAIGLSMLAVAAPVHAQRGPGGVYCASNDNRFARCQVPWRDAELVQQASKVRCIRGQTWGFDRNGIWVDHGCRGQFAPARGGRPIYGGPGPARPPGWEHPRQVRCESHNGSYQRCPVDLHRDDNVRLVRQLSGAACYEGRTWGRSRDGIWVNRGCRADFVVERRR